VKCKHCGKAHDSSQHRKSFESLDKLSDAGFPTHSKKYKEAHQKANKQEKEKFGKKAFEALEKIDNKLSKHELAGKNTKSGKIEVSKKVPPKFRTEVAFHEKVENKALRKKK
jgi:hypothetical protein